PSLALHRERTGAGRGGRREPGVALALVLDVEGGRANVRGSRRAGIARRPRTITRGRGPRSGRTPACAGTTPAPPPPGRECPRGSGTGPEPIAAAVRVSH